MGRVVHPEVRGQPRPGEGGARGPRVRREDRGGRSPGADAPADGGHGERASIPRDRRARAVRARLVVQQQRGGGRHERRRAGDRLVGRPQGPERNRRRVDHTGRPGSRGHQGEARPRPSGGSGHNDQDRHPLPRGGLRHAPSQSEVRHRRRTIHGHVHRARRPQQVAQDLRGGDRLLGAGGSHPPGPGVSGGRGHRDDRLDEKGVRQDRGKSGRA